MTLAHPTDEEALARLREAGVPERAAHAYGALVSQAHAALDADGVPHDWRRAWIAPGRIEVLGKHVDYAGGRSLVCAIDRGIVVVARRRDDARVVVRDAVLGEVATLALDDADDETGPPWRAYVRIVARRLVRNFGDAVRGCDVALASNLPAAAGVSSSASLIVGLGLALAHTSGLVVRQAWRDAIPDDLALAGYFAAMENGSDFGPLGGDRGLGLLNGAQDQTAILCSRTGALGVFAWLPVRHEGWVPWPADHAFVVAVSGVTAEKSGDARDRYNRVSRTITHLLDAWNRTTGRHDPSFGAALGSGPEARGLMQSIARRAATPEFHAALLETRILQFMAESYEHVPRAAEALVAGDLHAFAVQVARSQAWAERALGNQVPETITLVQLALAEGAVAASAFGAGFGGSVWAMVPQADVTPFMERWRAGYVAAFPMHGARSHFFATRPGTPAFELTAV